MQPQGKNNSNNSIEIVSHQYCIYDCYLGHVSRLLIDPQ